MRTVFIADDGKVFNTFEECEKYEENMITEEDIDEAVSTIVKKFGKYIPLKKRMRLRTAIVDVLREE